MNKTTTIIVIISSVLVASLLFIFLIILDSPDSPLGQQVGRNLPNFVEYTKTENVSISDVDVSMIIYFNKTHSKYTQAGKRGDESYLVLKNLSDDSEEILFSGNLGHGIDNLFIDKKNQRLLYTFKDDRKELGKVYLIVFDLETMHETDKIPMNGMDSYTNSAGVRGLGSLVLSVLFDDDNDQILYLVHNSKNSINAYVYFSIDINTGSRQEISKNRHKELQMNTNAGRSHVFYLDNGQKKELFFVYPMSEYRYANYKQKYNGIYINDGSQNIRISQTSSPAADSRKKAFWFENGNYVICGSYLYDTTGKKEALKIVDGEVLAVY